MRLMELQVGALTELASFDVADLEARSVRVVPLLLQTGLLSLVAGTPAQCRAPNEYARRSLQRLVAKVLSLPPAKILPLTAALRARDRAAFAAMAHLLVAKTPRTIMKQAPDGVDENLVRESAYHSLLFGALIAAAPSGVDVYVEVSVNVGVADIVVKFAGEQPVVWILEGASSVARTRRRPCRRRARRRNRTQPLSQRPSCFAAPLSCRSSRARQRRGPAAASSRAGGRSGASSPTARYRGPRSCEARG